MTQDELKKLAAQKAVEFVPENEYIGIGSGSTVAYFIAALGQSGKTVKGAVATSPETSRLMAEHGIAEIHANEVGKLSVYIDGADEINHLLQMIKGGGGAHVREKIVASLADKIICIADESKYVSRLGRFPLPVAVVPLARSMVARQIVKMGGVPELRIGFQNADGNEILDVTGLDFNRPIQTEHALNEIVGVVENGLFAQRGADLLILARKSGVELLTPRASMN